MSDSEKHKVSDTESPPYPEGGDRKTSLVVGTGEIVNASGHRDQLKRQYGLLSICGLALTIDNAWVALGGSIAVSISACLSHSRLSIYVLCIRFDIPTI